MKDQALELARDPEVGPVEASRRMDIPFETIRTWMKRSAASTDAPAQQSPRRRGAKVDELEHWETHLSEQLTEAGKLTREGKHLDAKACTVQAGIATEKILLLRRDRVASAASAVVDPADREQRIAKILELQERVLEHRRKQLRAKLFSVGDPVTADWWLRMNAGCVWGAESVLLAGVAEPLPRAAKGWASSLQVNLNDPYTTVFMDRGRASPVSVPRVRAEPVPVVVREIGRDEDVVEGEPVEEVPVRRALPAGSPYGIDVRDLASFRRSRGGH